MAFAALAIGCSSVGGKTNTDPTVPPTVLGATATQGQATQSSSTEAPTTQEDSPAPTTPAGPKMPWPEIKTTHPHTVRVTGLVLEQIEAECPTDPGKAINASWNPNTTGGNKYSDDGVGFMVGKRSITIDNDPRTKVHYLSVVFSDGSGPQSAVDFKVLKPVAAGTWKFTGVGDGFITLVNVIACAPYLY
ncbi:hypothetical protein [Kribbella ginsengisoli]|uniref:hypothetical protein n=1 Tax=Kribbella ginsengisoli TaxID=363865 RepID=UPI0031DC7A08